MKKIHECRVLHDGWGLDNECWVIENADGSRQIRTTNHGHEGEMSFKEIDEKIAEMEKSIAGLKKAKELVS